MASELAPAETPAIEQYQDERDPSVGPDWRVTDISGADWALARVAEMELEIEANEELGARAITQIEERVRKMNDQAMRGVTFFRARIEEFARANREALLGGGKKKSRKLVHGSIGWRSSPAGLKVEDEAKLLAWAQAQPVELGLVRIKEEPNIAGIKAYAAANKVIPPGMAEAVVEEKLEIKAQPVGLLKGDKDGHDA
jgi:phage host-nuclease inhibitor protein Gam